jgi:hypothetical protein
LRKLGILLLAMLLSAFLVACDEDSSSNADANKGGNNVEDTSKNEDVENEPEEEPADDKLGIGDTAEIDGVKLTVNAISTTDERNEFAEEDPNMVVKVEYEIENSSDEEISIGMDFQVYDGTGNQMELYPLDNTMGSLVPGKKMQGTVHYGIGEGPIELYFKPILSFSGEEAIFELDVE